MDRFQPILAGEKLCFLCLKPTDLCCEKCLLPYCNQEHYKVHYNKEDEYCYPFRVLQKPMVCFSFLKNAFFSCIFGWSDHKKCSFVDLILQNLNDKCDYIILSVVSSSERVTLE